MRTLRSIRMLVPTLSVLALALTIGLLQAGGMAEAAGFNVTGTVREPNNSYASGAYVYATMPGSSTPKYGPVTTNAYGLYSLPVNTPGVYDIHIDPPANNKTFSSIVNSNTDVNAALTINGQFTVPSYTFSGTMRDETGAAISGMTVKLGTGQSTTNASGAYSITVPAGSYGLYLEGGFGGMHNIKLTQSSNTAINLTSSDLALDITIRTATVAVTPLANSGAPIGGSVYAIAQSGSTRLYPGDPGTNVTFVNSYGTTSGNVTTIRTIVGATYAASGLGATSYTTSICKPAGSNLYDCLRQPLTVKENMSLNIPQAETTRTFSGRLTDSDGNPIYNAQVKLLANDTSTYGVTNANGDFSINAMPKKYFLKIEGSGNGMQSYSLTQTGANPGIDLTPDDIVQDLQVKTATLTINAKRSDGSPAYSSYTLAQTSSGTTTLYSGGPSMAINIANTSYLNGTTSATGTLGTIIGAVYAAKGLNATNTNGSICVSQVQAWNCLTTAYTVTGSATLGVPF